MPSVIWRPWTATASPGGTHSPPLFSTWSPGCSFLRERDRRPVVTVGPGRGALANTGEMSPPSRTSRATEFASTESRAADSASATSSGRLDRRRRRRRRRRKKVNRIATARATRIHHHLEEVPSEFGSPGNAAIRISDKTVQTPIPINRSTRSRATPRERSAKCRIEIPYWTHWTAIVNVRNASA